MTKPTENTIIMTLLWGVIVPALALTYFLRDPSPPRAQTRTATIKAPTKHETALKRRLAYLEDIPGVTWVKYDDNTVYIGFVSRPKDWRSIINAAAIHGNRETGFGVHVWAMDDSKYTGKPLGEGPSFGIATARHGKIQP